MKITLALTQDKRVVHFALLKASLQGLKADTEIVRFGALSALYYRVKITGSKTALQLLQSHIDGFRLGLEAAAA